ncbi:RNA polymerase factor sigma-54 [uncultured Desulfovibrio sp.]|uniref:RNA polymerase factor sigma-54 n=1 Tax=uncultured Desulfovibrio sp. TaxID=167968 RepID=UPI00262B8652|nr:RNA polymerase factor sigma-54 [uncultured Desulfovibrio sp.]
MALELRQQLKLTQQLVMTPQLQQAIKLLQLSRVELLETVQQELLENPFLEESSSPAEDAPVSEDTREPVAEDAYDREVARDADWEDYLGEFASTPRLVQPREYEVAEDISPLEARYSAKPTLEAHLMWQLRLSQLTEAQKEIGEVIIGNLSSGGYLQASLEDLAEMAHATPDEVRPVLERVQLFDPVGVAARDARECLLIQIRNLRYDRDPILLELVQSHLEDLEAKRYKPLLRKFKIDMEELREYLDIIQSLDPLPGASFGGGEPTYVSPDVFVYKMGDDFVILLNDDGLPQLQLSSLSQMDLGGSDKEKEYCAEKLRSASWLIKSLYQRQRTLYKVMESIVRHQRPFFEEGVTKLAPLILKDIADDINMHESTVSRITTNKYAATPHGIFELKFFFNSGLELDDGSQVGSESVKALIKKFIAEEDAKAPLSDERIGEMLKDSLKVNIARRTVAKYRTALGIPSSSRRKEHF